MPQLTLYESYDRRAVHDIFDPSSSFSVGAGSWGLQGIIRIPGQSGDFVLFVTLGKQEGAHQFDESINDQGILRWQSQPKQNLTSTAIRELLNHDETVNVVHLFLRTARLEAGTAPPYFYLGPLKYAGHDAEREQPAHIAWQLLAWPIPEAVLVAMKLSIVTEQTDLVELPTAAPSHEPLVEEEPPTNVAPAGEKTLSFVARKIRFQSSDQSRALGLQGELLVLERERRRLSAAGRADLANQVVHTSVIHGDGAGYDIASFFVDGMPKYIEVKTTTGPKNSDFLISPNEIAFSEKSGPAFELCRVFKYNQQTATARSYSVYGDIRTRFALLETQYRARILA